MKAFPAVILVVLVVLVLATPVLAQTAPPDRPLPDRTRQAVDDFRSQIEHASFRNFNWVALLAVTVAVFILTIVVWFLQLVIAKVLVFLLPVLCGVFAGMVLPKEPADSLTMLVFAGAIVVAGTSASLVFMLYATIFDLRAKVKALENR